VFRSAYINGRSAHNVLVQCSLYTGRDGSRAFITGDFTESGLTDDVISLTAEELHSLHEWAQFYCKEYKYLGKTLYTMMQFKFNPSYLYVRKSSF
jgi:hypothetical protein